MTLGLTLPTFTESHNMKPRKKPAGETALGEVYHAHASHAQEVQIGPPAPKELQLLFHDYIIIKEGLDITRILSR